MRGPSGVALALAPTLACAVAFVTPCTAAAQDDPRHAVDRFEPAERGSEWFANESLDLRGRARPSAGYVIAISHRSRAPVEDLAYLHVGGSVVLVDRLRVAMSLPFQLNASGETTTVDGTVLPPPRKSAGVGDLRLAVDVRLFGAHRGPITGAVGLQAWAPTGQESQWASDGVFRVGPRAMISGEVGAFVWAAQTAFFARERSEVAVAAASGVRFANAVVVGPEIFASTVTSDAFAKRNTPVEVLLGVHWLVDGTGRIAGGVGRGLTDEFGAPAWRAIVTVEWAPELAVARPRPRGTGRSGPGARPAAAPPDGDRDTVPDAIDACPHVVGVRTDDPRTNGCPPDADEDGIDDLADACPTLRGIPTSNPATNGCPDRDRDADAVPDDVDACPDDRGAADVDPRRNGCPKAFVRESRIVLLDQVEFKPGSAEITASTENESLLTAVLGALLKLPEGRKVRIEGHTEDRGDAGFNRKLGAARAAAVARWLAEHGIDRARLTAVGVGPDRPIATNETEAGRAENRRLEFHLEP